MAHRLLRPSKQSTLFRSLSFLIFLPCSFYLQWCPPCLRLLKELRRLHNYVENIKIGTIDCVQHGDICRKANANA